MLKVVIRNAKMSDLKQMKTINEQCLQENYDIEFWHEIWTSNKSCCFVAICSNIVIAYVLASKDSIVSFAVNEKYRNKKIGTELIKHALNNFINDVKLNVRVTNEIAKKLYLSMGFTEDKIVEKYYRNPEEDAIEMVYKYDKTKKFAIIDKLKIESNNNCTI